jgi:hypothetical protein
VAVLEPVEALVERLVCVLVVVVLDNGTVKVRVVVEDRVEVEDIVVVTVVVMVVVMVVVDVVPNCTKVWPVLASWE